MHHHYVLKLIILIPNSVANPQTLEFDPNGPPVKLHLILSTESINVFSPTPKLTPIIPL